MFGLVRLPDRSHKPIDVSADNDEPIVSLIQTARLVRLLLTANTTPLCFHSSLTSFHSPSHCAGNRVFTSFHWRLDKPYLSTVALQKHTAGPCIF
jgi:hypothetical protein